MALTLAACSGQDTVADSGENQTPMSDMHDMHDMQAMQAMDEDGMMQQMQSHMRLMDGAGADSITSMLPMHRQMVANMIAQFNQEMRDMNMPSDSAWNATVDSLRQDLMQMPEMRASDLSPFMAAHGDRVTRIMESHRMMRAMKP